MTPPLKTLKPRVWWIVRYMAGGFQFFDHEPDKSEVGYGKVIKVHDSAYVRLLERIVAELISAAHQTCACTYKQIAADNGDDWVLKTVLDEECLLCRALTAVQQMCEEFKGVE